MRLKMYTDSVTLNFLCDVVNPLMDCSFTENQGLAQAILFPRHLSPLAGVGRSLTKNRIDTINISNTTIRKRFIQFQRHHSSSVNSTRVKSYLESSQLFYDYMLDIPDPSRHIRSSIVSQFFI